MSSKCFSSTNLPRKTADKHLARVVGNLLAKNSQVERSQRGEETSLLEDRGRHLRAGVSILMSYGENPHYVKLPIFSEFMENSAKLMKNSGLTKWTQNLR